MIYTPETLATLRRQGDPLADATVEELFAKGQVGEFNALMRWFGQSGQDLPSGLPGVARDYLSATRMPPEWVDWTIMENARLFFIDNNVHVSTALSFASMPACYSVPRVARLLSATHSLDYPSRRMAETGQFTVFLMRPDAFEAGGRFIPAAQKVRLLHAAIRYHLRRSGQWDETADGLPISQEDMIGGQMMFSIQVLDAMDRLGVHITREGADAYYYAWRVVGAILGIEAAPPDLESARRYSDLYMAHNMGPSEEGARLTRQLIKLYEDAVPGTFFDPVVPGIIRYLIGDTTADWLGVPTSAWDNVVKAVPLVQGFLEDVEDRSPLGQWLLDRIGNVTTNLELSSLTRGRVMHYAIPEQLKAEYGLKPPRTERWTPPPITVEEVEGAV